MKLRIGEMSKIFNVSTDTLRFYDREGVLAPKKDENGYRYYEHEEFDQLYYILLLRSLGVSLDEIRTLMQNRHVEGLEGLLKERKSYVQQEIQRLKNLEKKVDHHLNVISSVRKERKIKVVETPPFSLTLYPDSEMNNKEKVLEASKLFHQHDYGDEGVFLFEKIVHWKPTHWGMKKLNGEAYIKEAYCLHGYFTGTFEELSEYTSELEKEYEEEGIYFTNQLIFIESFYIGSGEKAQTVGEFYLPIRKKD